MNSGRKNSRHAAQARWVEGALRARRAAAPPLPPARDADAEPGWSPLELAALREADAAEDAAIAAIDIAGGAVPVFPELTVAAAHAGVLLSSMSDASCAAVLGKSPGWVADRRAALRRERAA